LHEKLPNKSKLGLYFNPYGRVLDLIDDCIACAVDQLMQQLGGPAWTQEDFSRLQESVRGELNDCVVNIALQVEKILSQVFSINKRLKGRIDLTQALAMADIRQQMDKLIYPGFVAISGSARLADILRYMQGIERRMDKLAMDVNRDRAQQLKIANLEQHWQQALAKLPVSAREQESVKTVRWMLEELRVSYFAQQLGTAYPISDKRILQAIEQWGS